MEIDKAEVTYIAKHFINSWMNAYTFRNVVVECQAAHPHLTSQIVQTFVTQKTPALERSAQDIAKEFLQYDKSLLRPAINASDKVIQQIASTFINTATQTTAVFGAHNQAVMAGVITLVGQSNMIWMNAFRKAVGLTAMLFTGATIAYQFAQRFNVKNEVQAAS